MNIHVHAIHIEHDYIGTHKCEHKRAHILSLIFTNAHTSTHAHISTDPTLRDSAGSTLLPGI